MSVKAEVKVASLRYAITVLNKKIAIQDELLKSYEDACRALRNTICILEGKKPI